MVFAQLGLCVYFQLCVYFEHLSMPDVTLLSVHLPYDSAQNMLWCLQAQLLHNFLSKILAMYIECMTTMKTLYLIFSTDSTL